MLYLLYLGLEGHKQTLRLYYTSTSDSVKTGALCEDVEGGGGVVGGDHK